MLRRSFAPCLAAAAVVLLSGPAAVQAQPTPDFTWNNFVSAGTTWGGTNNWLTNPGGLPTTITAATASIDRVLGFGSSPLQTVTGYTTTNNLGGFNLNSMVFSANSNVSGGVTVTNTAATDSLTFNTNSAAVLPSIWQTGTGRVAFRHVVAGAAGITLAGGAAGTTLQVLGGGVGDTFLDTSIAQTGAGASGLLINQTGGRSFFTGSQVRLGGSASSFTGGVNLTAGNLVLSNVLGTTGAFNPTLGVGSAGPPIVVTTAAPATVINSLGATNGTTTGVLTVNGGSVQFDPLAISSGAVPTGATGTLQVNNPLLLNATLNLTGVAPATAPSGGIVGIFGGPISGAAGITVAPSNGTLVYGFTGAGTFAGPVVIQPVGNTVATLQAGTANVATGTFAGTTAFTVTGNSSLTLNNMAGAATRLNTTTAPSLTLNRANFNLFGNATAAAAETFGQLTTVGMGSLSVYSGSGTVQSSTATFASLSRGPDGRGTLSLNATNLGSGTGAGEGVIVFTADPGGAVGGGTGAGTVTRSILPYAAANAQAIFAAPSTTLSAGGSTLNGLFISGSGNTNTTLGLVRWDSATGRIAPLAANEYAANLATTGTAAPAANVRLTSTATTPLAFGVAGLALPTTVNSLTLDTNTAVAAAVGVSVAGPATLTVGGGAVLVGSSGNTGVGTITLPSLLNLGGLNFGAATGYFHTNSNLTVNAPISGSGGVVKSLGGLLQLNGTNTFTGGLTVNSGPVQFFSDANLGAAGQPITLNSGLTTALQFQPSNLFGPTNVTGVTVNRPVTIGAGGGVISPALVNGNLTLSGAVSGPGQLFKGSNGVLSLTGANTGFTGNLVAGGGILAVQNDAAMGGPGAGLLLAGGTFQPLSSFSTAKEILVTAQSFIFTAGNNLTLTGNVTSQFPPGTSTLLKVGTGDLVLTAANTFNGPFQLGESGPLTRATAASAAQTPGRLLLTGLNGSLAQASSVFSIAGGEIVLDNVTDVNQNRVGNVTLSLVGGNVTLLGNAGVSVNEQIGALSVSNGNNQYGGRLTIVTPAGSGQVTTLTATAAFSPQAAPNVGTLFVRGTNLGAAAGDRTAVVVPVIAAANLSNGLVTSIVGATSATAADPTDFIAPQTIVNAAPNSNQNALVPFTAYTAPPPLATPAAGLATATYDVTAPSGFTAGTAANALRIQAGGSVDLGGGTLSLTSGNVLSTGGANGGITNGTLAYAAGVTARFSVAAGSDLTVSTAFTTTTGGLNKLGGGTLTLTSLFPTTTGLVGVSAGTLKYGAANVLPAASVVFVNAGATLDLNGNTSTLGGLAGWGSVKLGAGNLTLNVPAAPIVPFGGGFDGAGALIKSGTAVQTLAGASPTFSGDVRVLGGTLQVNSTDALGTGTTPILLGDTTGTVQALLNLGNVFNTFGRDVTVQAGSTPATPHVFGIGLASGVITSNFTLNQTLRLQGTSGVSGSMYALNGNLTGPGGLFIFSGNWALNGANGYTGGTTFSTTAATGIAAGSDTAFGTGSLTFDTSGANLRADNGPRTLANNVVILSGGYFGTAGTNPLALNGSLDLSAVATAVPLNIVNTAPTTIGGAIQNGSGGVVKNGPGTLVLTGTSTYTGPTVVNAGTLQIGGGGATGAIPAAGAVTVNTGAILAFNRSDTATFANAVGGAGAIVQAGTGVTSLTAANTYTGPTTVNAGNLQVAAGASTGTGATTVNSGGTLSGVGTVGGPTTVNSGGTLAPGLSPGVLTAAGPVAFTSGSNFRIALTGSPTSQPYNSGASAAPGPTGNSQLAAGVNGITFPAGTNVVVDVTGTTFSPSQPYSFSVATGTGISPSGPFAPVSVGTFTFLNGGVDVTSSFGAAPGPSLVADSGNTVFLNFTPVPEPATVLAVAGLGLAGVRLRRRVVG